MAVRVRATDIEDGRLPPVCVVTGEPADHNWNVRYVNPPGALLLLLFAGVLPYLLARTFTQNEVEGPMPISAAGIALVRDRRRARWSWALGALGLAVAGIVAGVLVESWVVAVGALVVAFVAWMYSAVRFASPVDGDVESNGRWVRLTGAHPAFVRALEAGALTSH